MTQPLDRSFLQHVDKLDQSSGLACPLCKHQQHTLLSDDSAFEAHLQRAHGDEISKLQQTNPSFDIQVWSDGLKSQAKVKSLHRPRKEKPQGNTPLPQTSSTSSPNISQEFGELNISDQNTRKRSPTRKGEPPPGQVPHGWSGMKRQKLTPERKPAPSPPRKSEKSSRGKRRQRENRAGPSGPHQPQLQLRPAPQAGASTGASSAFQNAADHGTQSSKPPPTGPQPLLSQPQMLPSQVNMPTDPRYPGIYLQPESREISQEQLAAEVKSIYSGLSMVETKCMHVDAAQLAAIQAAQQNGTQIVEDHWQALIALHRTLLHEHHDFFLASQHPSASPALKRLAAKYSMPARMWKHGIHSFLELLRCRLPQSKEYMRTFIYFAYHMMALLYETVPSFEDTWIECLGDLGRYRMAIEDDDPRERDSWAGISQYWYRMAADRSPGVGRLYHHLAILARSEAFQQIYYYCRSFTCIQLFPSARESVLAVFEPIFNRSNTSTPVSRIDTFYTKMHGMLFLRKQLEDFKAVTSNFLELLDNHINRSGIKWREHGAWLAISNIGALFEHGSNNAVLRRLFEHLILHRRQESEGLESENAESQSVSSRGPPTPSSSTDIAIFEPDHLSRTAFYYALDMTVFTSRLVLRRTSDRNVLPHVQILLAFILVLVDIQSFNLSVQREYVNAILDRMPWEDLVSFANTLGDSEEFGFRYETPSFLQPETGDVGPLPEDYLLRGQIWTQTLFPIDWWRDDEIDAEDKSIEHASTVRKRGERVLNHMYRVAQRNKWIQYNRATKIWTAISRSADDGHSPDTSPTIEIGSALLPSLSIQKSPDAEMEDTDELEVGEPEDVSMSDVDSQVSDDDSPEMLFVKKDDKLRHATQRLGDSQGLSVPSRSIGQAKQAEELMRKGFTVLVCDLDLLRYSLDVFKLIADRGFDIVIPSNAIFELVNFSKTESSKYAAPKAEAAHRVIEEIRTAIDHQKKIQILTQEGKDVTSSALLPGKAPSIDEDDEDDPEEIIVRVSRQASDLSSRGQLDEPDQKGKPAIVVSDLKSTRLKVSNQGIAALSVAVVKQLLEAVRRRRSSSATSSQWHSGLMTPAEIIS